MESMRIRRAVNATASAATTTATNEPALTEAVIIPNPFYVQTAHYHRCENCSNSVSCVATHQGSPAPVDYCGLCAHRHECPMCAASIVRMATIGNARGVCVCPDPNGPISCRACGANSPSLPACPSCQRRVRVGSRCTCGRRMITEEEIASYAETEFQFRTHGSERRNE